MKSNHHSPPSILLKFFRWFCDPNLVEDIEGDMVERFEKRIENKGHKKARRLFVRDVFQLLRPGIIKSFSGHQKLNQIDMLKHNLLISFRSFMRYKSAFLINLIGLSSGLACTLFIYLWVQDERGIDKFHTNDANLYQVITHHEESGAIRTQDDTQGILAEALEKEVPEIEMALQSTPAFWFGDMPLTIGDKTIKAPGKFVDKRYFEMFTFPLIDGTAESVLASKESIVLSESLAKSLFNTTEGLIGKTLHWQLLNMERTYQIGGVFEDVPANSTETFDFVMSYEVFSDIVGDGMQWGNYNALTYVTLKPNVDVDHLNEKLAPFVKNKVSWSNVTPSLRPYSDKYLYSKYENGVQAGGRIEYVKLFSIISIIILIIACINFMNLSTAKASRKAKEVGVKKAIGAQRKTLIFQYMEESFLMTFVAIVLAIGLVLLFLPQFNDLTNKQISLVFDTNLVKALGAVLVITGFIAGSYPALYLSGLNSITALKGKMKSSIAELWARKGLVVFQFTISIILIVSVLIVHKQIDFVQNKNLGYEKENLVLFANEGKVATNHDAFIDRVKALPGVVNASSTAHTIINGGSTTTGLTWEGQNPEIETSFGNISVFHDFIETLGVEVIAGRSFSNELVSDSSKLILNEKAIEVIGMTDPVGKMVNLWGQDMQIIGVVKDFHFQSLHETVTPMFFKLDPSFLTNIVVRIEAGQERTVVDRIESVYKEYNPDFDFNFTFLDQDYAQQYASERRISTLSRCFGGIAIIISCLGLFGLAAFTAERKSKEIGVRKALGASSVSIVRLLSNEFNKMVGLAVLIALPLSYYLISGWLEGFAYQIDLKVWYFLGAGAAALFIAWLTVGLQTFKAAKINPSQSLRSE